MKFTTPDGKPVEPVKQPEPGKVEETAASPAPSATEAEVHRESMTFHGDTTTIDTRKGRPTLLEDTTVIEQKIFTFIYNDFSHTVTGIYM